MQCYMACYQRSTKSGADNFMQETRFEIVFVVNLNYSYLGVVSCLQSKH